MNPNGEFPRPLKPHEQDLIGWVLPAESPGYARYRDFVGRSLVLGRGRRGVGEIVLGASGALADLTAPLPPVYAYGVVETPDDIVSVTVREIFEDQLSAEIVGKKSDEVSTDLRIVSRWTFSTWRPGLPCPQCSANPRTVLLPTPGGTPAPHAIAFCRTDLRFWIFDGIELTCRPNPVTNFYNELMLRMNIRDPKIALEGKNLYTDLTKYSDEDLSGAFASYNRMKNKLSLGRPPSGKPAPRGPLGRFLKSILPR